MLYTAMFNNVVVAKYAKSYMGTDYVKRNGGTEFNFGVICRLKKELIKISTTLKK